MRDAGLNFPRNLPPAALLLVFGRDVNDEKLKKKKIKKKENAPTSEIAVCPVGIVCGGTDGVSATRSEKKKKKKKKKGCC